MRRHVVGGAPELHGATSHKIALSVLFVHSFCTGLSLSDVCEQLNSLVILEH
jgi:hypothetical protein